MRPQRAAALRTFEGTLTHERLYLLVSSIAVTAQVLYLDDNESDTIFASERIDVNRRLGPFRLKYETCMMGNELHLYYVRSVRLWGY